MRLGVEFKGEEMGSVQRFKMVAGKLTEYETIQDMKERIGQLEREKAEQSRVIESMRQQVEAAKRETQVIMDKNLQGITAFLGKLSSELAATQAGIFKELSNLNMTSAERQKAKVQQMLELLGMNTPRLGYEEDDR